jgi:hypothetical protein
MYLKWKMEVNGMTPSRVPLTSATFWNASLD